MFIKEAKKEKLNSTQIKLVLMEYFRYKKQYIGVVSEYAHYCDEIEDIVAFKNFDIAVVEIKISKSDFLKDFKKPKHSLNCNKIWYSHFYFCVTEELKDFALRYLKENGYKHYGILVANGGNGNPFISTARPAKRFIYNGENKIFRYGLFHRENRYTLEAIIRRMSSELVQNKRKVISATQEI